MVSIFKVSVPRMVSFKVLVSFADHQSLHLLLSRYDQLPLTEETVIVSLQQKYYVDIV